MELQHQVVLVTGAGRGVGMAIATAFARTGAKVVLNYRRSRAPAEAAAAELGPERAVALQADVTRREEVDAMFEAAARHFGQPVTTVINNALPDFSFNGDARCKADAIGWTEFAAQLEGALGGALNTVQAALLAMRQARFGRIVNIGSNLFQNPVVP
ncbi:MAG TPA: SDR family NAD(P)-dependent oxidoreductase, partial [Rhodanobacteraceae bacterium]|nr:SDR family NAD(P)-dependent oxidoreductase [Rhodanobacteraceae bacterium]